MINTWELTNAERQAIEFAQKRQYAGSDPYDGLTSPVAKILTGRIPRQAWVQLHKRAGSRTRQFTGVRPIRMTKGLALFAQGAALVGRNELASNLINQISKEKGAGPWGYEFDVQTRWAHYLAGSPNVVATVFTLRAFDDTKSLDKVSKHTKQWLSGLWHNDGYFKYTEASGRLVHNGNLLAAEGLELVGGHSDLVKKAIETTVERQRSDGSWSYGEGPGLEWIDNFHTIYNLESLMFLRARGYDVSDAPERGYKYWMHACMTKEHLPTYFAGDATASSDVHNVATAVGFLARTKTYGWDSPMPDAAINYLLSMQGEDGGFRNSPKKPPYMRWNQGHAYLAIARWMNALQIPASRSVHDHDAKYF